RSQRFRIAGKISFVEPKLVQARHHDVVAASEFGDVARLLDVLVGQSWKRRSASRGVADRCHRLEAVDEKQHDRADRREFAEAAKSRVDRIEVEQNPERALALLRQDMGLAVHGQPAIARCAGGRRFVDLPSANSILTRSPSWTSRISAAPAPRASIRPSVIWRSMARVLSRTPPCMRPESASIARIRIFGSMPPPAILRLNCCAMPS